ncbi:MAG: C_GCAxxG_C_C family protein [Epulopiscium sp.]|jgi:C_GCAxxG_C_C family probable redox protein|nr:C_GCAxxG_C_C family protein [Candidatus Epulonipiscium sp.]
MNTEKGNTTEKTTEELMQEADTIAKNYFKQGLNCSECVLRTIMDLNDTGLPPEVIRLASGFGAGMGKTKNTCGAITGAVLAVGATQGRANPMEKPTTAERAKELVDVYKPFASMIHEIEDTYGTLICKELSDPHGDFECKERKKSCMQIIGYCAALAEKYTAEAKKMQQSADTAPSE